MQKTIMLALVLILASACKEKTKENITVQKKQEKINNAIPSVEDFSSFFKLSLAQWSFHNTIQSGEMDILDFAQRAKALGFEGIEYVSQLYRDKLNEGSDAKQAMQALLNTLKSKSDTHQIQNLIIMVDREGHLASTDKKERDQAVENHKKWVDAASFLGCHSIRVNLSGTEHPEQWVEAATKGLRKLTDYGASKKINIIVENHGNLSSNAALLVRVIQKVDNPYCGTLPDFGNFCLKRNSTQRKDCVDEYPKYEGVEEMMPYAKAVSAKSYDFNAEGNETTIDYKKMLEIVKHSGYNGFIGVEYEGERLSEKEGVIATRDLLIKTAKQLR